MRTVYILAPALLALAISSHAAAQADDQSQVILPLEAQTCNLPSAPARIPENAEYEDLAKAQGQIKEFQARMVSYRECLEDSRQSGDLTEGNEIALVEAHNYSVEMEERIAEQFNIAVRSYKARKAEQERSES